MAGGMRELINGEAEVLTLGAEAALVKASFLGAEVVIKVRLPKGYRDPALDSLIRARRTAIEAKIIRTLSDLGINVPTLLYVDVEKSTIIMEYIRGYLLRDIIIGGDIHKACSYLDQVGSYVALMHKAGISHGDLTTTNVVVSEGNAYLIDFGLSKFTSRIEDLATDIHLFIRSLESVHYRHRDELLECFLKGYRSVAGELLSKVFRVAKEIRLRGRYVEERREEALRSHNQ